MFTIIYKINKKMIKKYLFILIQFIYFFNYAQIGIGTTTPQGALDVTSTSDGLLIPRVALVDTVTPVVETPTQSELVFNTATSGTAPNQVSPGFYYWNGTLWVKLLSEISAIVGWDLIGNSGTNDDINFIGTTDNVPLNFRINNQKSGRLTSTGETFFGYQAGFANTEVYNSGLGYQSLFANSTGNWNTATGYRSLFSNTTGSLNSATGSFALRNNTTGFQNTAIGSFALNLNTTGYDNAATGSYSLNFNTTGYGNTANGSYSLFVNSTGIFNTATGGYSLHNNTIGNNNTSNGYYSLFSNTTGIEHSAFGSYSLQKNTTGSRNTAFGSNALRETTTGSNNVAIGTFCLQNSTTAIGNTAIGFQTGVAGTSILTGSFNTLVGYTASSDSSVRTNCIALAGNGNLNFGGDNRVRIGNNAMTSIGGQVSWTTISDQRVKQNVQQDVKVLDFILKLKPVTYNYSIEQSNQIQKVNSSDDWSGKFNIEKMRFSGFLAQEVQNSAREVGYDFSGVDQPQDANGLWGLRYAEFTVPLVKAVQELHEKNELLMQQNDLLQQQIQLLTTRLQKLEQQVKP